MLSGSFYILCGRHLYVFKPYKSSTMQLPVSHIEIMSRKWTLMILLCCSALWWLQVWNSVYTVLCGLLLLLCCLHWFLPPFILYCSLKVGFNWLPTGLAWLLLLVKKKHLSLQVRAFELKTSLYAYWVYPKKHMELFASVNLSSLKRHESNNL